jgi:hypothetical protein
MPFRTAREAEAAAIEVARADPIAKLCGGVGVVQERSSGLYRLVVAPFDQLAAQGTSYRNALGHEERLVAYVTRKDGWGRTVARAAAHRWRLAKWGAPWPTP